MNVHGRGSIRPKQQGARCRKWQLVVRTDAGRRTRVVRGTKREALRMLDDFKRELSGRVECSETFGGYARRWLGWRRASGDVAPQTVANDERDVRALLRVIDAGTPLDSVTPEMLRDALAELRNGGGARGRELSGAYLAGIHGTLHAIFAQAVADGRLASSPVDGVKRPKVDTREKRAMGADELGALELRLQRMPLDGRVVAVALICGLSLRRGEACALMDSDFTPGAVTVRGTVREMDGSIGGTKTEAGRRVLPPPAWLVALVERWREERAADGISDAPTLACACNGMPLRPQNLYRWWMAHRAELGADGYTLHQLRHSSLTRLAHNGATPWALKSWAGWSSVAPSRIYVHDDFDAMRALVERMDAGHPGARRAHVKEKATGASL